MDAGGRGQVTWKGLAVAVAAALCGGVLLGGALFGFGLDGQTDATRATPTTDPVTLAPTAEAMPTVNPTATARRASVTPTGTPTTTLPPTPSPTPTATPTQTATATPTVTPSPTNSYLDFIREFDGELIKTAKSPIRLRAGTIQNNTFYLVHNSTSRQVNTTKKNVEWAAITLAYGGAIRDHRHFDMNGSAPERLVVFEYNSSNMANEPRKFTVTNGDVWALVDGNITAPEFHGRWQDRLEPQSEADEELVTELDKFFGNSTVFPEGEEDN